MPDEYGLLTEYEKNKIEKDVKAMAESLLPQPAGGTPEFLPAVVGTSSSTAEALLCPFCKSAVNIRIYVMFRTSVQNELTCSGCETKFIIKKPAELGTQYPEKPDTAKLDKYIRKFWKKRV